MDSKRRHDGGTMRRAFVWSRLPAFVLAAGYLASGTPAMSQQAGQGQGQASSQGQGGDEAANQRIVNYADVTAGVGFSSSPQFGSGNSSSAFGRLSLFGFHAWNNERGSTSISGFVENTTYVQGGYGSKQIFRLNARTDRSVSEQVRVFADLGFSGDIAGQLTNRFTSPPVVTPPDTPPPVTNPDVINLSGRQYLLNGLVGAGISTSARSSVSLSAGATHAFFTGRNSAADYTSYIGSVGYSHQASERTWLGVNVSLQRQEFSGSDYSNVVNLAGTFRTQLAEDINANGSIGVLAIYEYGGGQSDHSYSPSFSGSICKSGEKSQLCANVSRTATTPLSIGSSQGPRGSAVTTNFDLSYSHELGRGEAIRALVTATRSSQARILNQDQLRTTYVTGLIDYNRKVGNRLFAGVSVGARKVFQTGPDPRTDFNGNVYLRYRLGDLL